MNADNKKVLQQANNIGSKT